MDFVYGLTGFVLFMAVFVLTVDELRKCMRSRWWPIAIPFILRLCVFAATKTLPEVSLERGLRRLAEELVFLFLCVGAVVAAKRWRSSN